MNPEVDGTSSAAEPRSLHSVVPGEVLDSISDAPPFTVPDDAGELMDQALAPAPREDRRRKDDGDAKSTPPRVDEWQDFFSRTVIKLATDWWINTAFKGIDENLLTEREIQRIRLEKDQRDRIARPFAELANKVKFVRKHGRLIVSSTDSVESAVELGQWFMRVNRIASKYRPRQPVKARVTHTHTQAAAGGENNVSSGQAENGRAETSANGYERPWYSTGTG